MTMDGPRRSGGGDRGGSELLTPKRIVAGVLILLFVIWCIVNRNTVDVSFLFFNVEIAVWIALLVAFVLGILFEMLLLRRRRHRDDD